MEPPEQVTVTAEGAAEHDAEAEELEVDEVAVIEMDDELVASVELDELLEIVELDGELESVADVETDEELESELEAVTLEDEPESELEAVALEDELEATELELDEGQGGDKINATCHVESVTS